MKLSWIKNGFLGVNQGENFGTDYGQAKAVVIPFGLENTVSYGKGTAKGPQAIINASHYVEIFDEQSGKKFADCGIATVKQPKIPKSQPQAVKLLSQITEQVVLDKKFPLILGGEHSLTQGSIAGLSRFYKNFSVLHFDAHSDTREDYYIGGSFSHGAVMNRVLRKNEIAKLVQVGIRSVSDQNGEMEFRSGHARKIKTFWAWEKFSPQEILKAIPTRDVFVSFDVDVFDPSIMPATGTPEPGGMLWWQTLDILKTVFANKNVIGADIVELAPIKHLHHPDYTVARLAYKIIGYKFF